MSTICQVYSLYAGELWLGRRDEGGMRSVAIDVSPWLADLVSGGTFMLAVSRPGEDNSPYNPAIVFDGQKIIWTPNDVDTAKAGTGTAELRYYVGTDKIKSKAFKTIVASAPYTLMDPPSAIEPFVERMEQAAANATAASASAAISAATATEQADTATTKASEASTSASQADASADAAAASATSAAGSATAAAQSATAASNAADDATESEQIAAAAANAATAASGTATTKAAEAAQSAATATNQAAAAAQSATSASSSAGDAEQAAETATTKASEASTSASQADASADAASASATSAAGSATAAAQSATAASNAQTVAEAARAAAQAARTGAEAAQTGAETAQGAAESAAASVSASAAQIATNTADITALKADFLQSLIYDTASGPVATFPDGAHNLPCKSVVAQIVPKQAGSGDPSPDNIRPIGGWDAVNVQRCGKNLLIKPFISRTSTTDTLADCFFIKAGTYYFSCTGVSSTPWRLLIRMKDGDGNNLSSAEYVPFLGAYFNATAKGWLDGSDRTVSAWSVLVTIVEDCYIRTLINAVDTSITAQTAQLELGSTATTYEPYTGSTYSVPLPQTVYGGEVDVVSGELVIDRAMVDLGTLNYEQRTVNGVARICTNQIDNIVTPNTDYYAPKGLCSIYRLVKTVSIGDADGTAAIGSATYGYGKRLIINDSRIANASEAAAVLSGQSFVYYLAEPITVSLTPQEVPTLYGSNTVYADSGDVAVEYPADTKLYISRLTEPDSADMIADANIVSGKYFMVGNDLYLATANIANGGAIVPGTNCTKVSLATALNTINA